METAKKERLRVEPLGRQHSRQAFQCGVESLNRYLTAQASQDMRRKANAVFVLVRESDPCRILGYFTLCSYGLTPGSVPEAARKYIPRYPLVSATLLGRLAVDKEQQGKGLGSILLAEALLRAYRNAGVVGSSMVVVDALDERAAGFYLAHGFIQLPESMRLILPIQTIARLVKK
jgi:GNAT superfamily N-acetyltransferase